MQVPLLSYARRGGGAYAIATIPFVVLACCLLSSKGLIVVDYLHDAFVLFDIEHRAAEGQIPHVDFHSPIGQAYSWPFALLAWLGDSGVTTLLRANVFVAGVIGALSFVPLKRRLSPAFFCLAVFAATTVVLSPRSYGAWIDSYSFLAPYNAWSWALLLSVALITLVPPDDADNGRRDMLDGIALGVLLALLMYMKVTFFLPAVGFLFAGLVLKHARLSTAVAAMLVVAAIAAIVEFLWHNNAGYWADLRMASRVNLLAPSRLPRFITEVKFAGLAAFGFLAVLALWDGSVSPKRLFRWWRPILVVFAMLAVGAVIATQNYLTVYIPGRLRMILEVQASLICGAYIAGGEMVRRRLRAEPQPLSDHTVALRHAIGWAGLLVAVTAVPLLDTASIVGHALESRSSRFRPIAALRTIAPQLLVSADVPVGQAHFAKPTYDAPWYAAYYTQQVEEAVALLKRNHAEHGVILAEDFSNPYPFLFKAPSPKGALIWWHIDRSYSENIHPPAEPMLRSATIILESKSPEYGAPIRKFSNDIMERDFRVADESELWRLWIKRTGIG